MSLKISTNTYALSIGNCIVPQKKSNNDCCFIQLIKKVYDFILQILCCCCPDKNDKTSSSEAFSDKTIYNVKTSLSRTSDHKTIHDTKTSSPETFKSKTIRNVKTNPSGTSSNPKNTSKNMKKSPSGTSSNPKNTSKNMKKSPSGTSNSKNTSKNMKKSPSGTSNSKNTSKSGTSSVKEIGKSSETMKIVPHGPYPSPSQIRINGAEYRIESQLKDPIDSVYIFEISSEQGSPLYFVQSRRRNEYTQVILEQGAMLQDLKQLPAIQSFIFTNVSYSKGDMTLEEAKNLKSVCTENKNLIAAVPVITY